MPIPYTYIHTYIYPAELSELDVKRIIDSIADNEAFLDFNMKPVERILSILVDEFDPKHPHEQACRLLIHTYMLTNMHTSIPN